MPALISPTDAGLYCQPAECHIDPWRPVARALLTHAHADHARPGSTQYICAEPSLALLRHRLGPEVHLQGVPYGERLSLGSAVVSFHPAGHVLGSAQIRIEAEGEVWVVSGDYKRATDPTCTPFEVVRCDTFVTEATYALPIFRWEPVARVAEEILAWWDANRSAGRASVLFCYALGKAQRILAELALLADRTVFVHGAIEAPTVCYRQAGISMLPTHLVSETAPGRAFGGELVLAPLPARGTRWMRRFGDAETGLASGAMAIRGARRRRGFDRGFVLSDHADWPALLRTIEETGAQRVITTVTYCEPLAQFLRERGLAAEAWPTSVGAEDDETGAQTRP